MRVRSLRIENFRNISLTALEDLGAVNVFIGENAQGKTNLLEAIHVVLSGTSFRVAQEATLLKEGEILSGVRVEVVLSEGVEKTVAVAWQRNMRLTKKIQINGTDTNRLTLLKEFPVVVFSPEDIDLIRLSPSYRRRSMDMMVSRMSAAYYQDLVDYTRVLKQRNQLLLNIRQGNSPESELDVWDEQLARLGTRLIEQRTGMVTRLSEIFAKYYVQFVEASTWARGMAEFSYVPNVATTSAADFKLLLEQMRQVDIIRATTTKGPHRDDYVFKLDGQDVKNLASRGEYRSLLLALKLAEGELVENGTGEPPVYLLDDPFSELDAYRIKRIAEVLSKRQVFVTSSDPSTIGLFNTPKVFEVKAGEIKEYVPTN